MNIILVPHSAGRGRNISLSPDQRFGHMQAELLRLNALGQRLARMGGLDKREFDFSEGPALGGPEPARGSSSMSVPDFLKTLEKASGQIERKSERLAALESSLLDKQLKAAVYPTGWSTGGGGVSSGLGQRAGPFTGRTAIHEGVDSASRFGSPIKPTGGRA